LFLFARPLLRVGLEVVDDVHEDRGRVDEAAGGAQVQMTLDHKVQIYKKKENQIFLKYKEIQSGAVAKSYVSKGFL
jgi:hypothetical protein